MMTMEQHVEELRAELKYACDAAERREIQTELELAQTELAIIIEEQDGSVDAEPPL